MPGPHGKGVGVVPDSFQPGADVILDAKLTQHGVFTATTLPAVCASKCEPWISGVSR